MDQLERARTASTKALILTSPLNPTGSLYPKALLKEIIALALKVTTLFGFHFLLKRKR